VIAANGRRLTWEGCVNARDLGGLRTADGGETRWRSVVRAGALDGLTAAGWAALEAHGVRTVIDLRNEDERRPGLAPRPAALTTLHVPYDSSDDAEFWDRWATGPQFGTPLYYRPFLERFPDRTARVMTAIAHAGPGGVLFHCARGRDRAGLVAILLLALAGVAPDDIAADYSLSADAVEGPSIEAFLASQGTSTHEIIVSLLASLDVESYLRAAGLIDSDLRALRGRLCGIAHA
jgi:protein-tyrosine phosphatase